MEWGGFAFSFYSITCFAVAFLLPVLARRTSRKAVHAGALVCGGIALMSMYFIRDPYLLLLTMVGVGIAWSSILSMPYAILSGAIPPHRMGVYMGVFNAFIVLPEIFAAVAFGRLIRLFFGADNPNAPLYVVMAGGAFMLVAAICVTFVRDVTTEPVRKNPSKPLEKVT
jgi:maltose/moltooligosaccharide transporter